MLTLYHIMCCFTFSFFPYFTFNQKKIKLVSRITFPYPFVVHTYPQHPFSSGSLGQHRQNFQLHSGSSAAGWCRWKSLDVIFKNNSTGTNSTWRCCWNIAVHNQNIMHCCIWIPLFSLFQINLEIKETEWWKNKPSFSRLLLFSSIFSFYFLRNPAFSPYVFPKQLFSHLSKKNCFRLADVFHISSTKISL
jgi:hypothetical protein